MLVKIRFNVGNKYVLVSMPFDKGEDVGESIKRFCVDEDIPCYLEPSILSALTVLCDEEAKGKHNSRFSSGSLTRYISFSLTCLPLSAL